MVILDFLSLYDKREMETILSYYFDLPRSRILMDLNREVSEEDGKILLDIIEKRKKNIPLQYILGRWNFYGREFSVRENVLIPRPETELLVERLLSFDTRDKSLLDICTGSGIIGISGYLEGDFRKVVLSDISPHALDLARENLERFNISDVDVIGSDLFENIEGIFSFITANPPYIKSGELDKLDKELSFEPRLSLDGREDGLYFYRRIVKDAIAHLEDGGKLILEIGYDQREDVNRLLEDSGYINIENIKDLNGFDRIVIGERG